jgi:hypothetical protein
MVGSTTPNFQGVPLQHDATSGKKRAKENITCEKFLFHIAEEDIKQPFDRKLTL